MLGNHTMVKTSEDVLKSMLERRAQFVSAIESFSDEILHSAEEIAAAFKRGNKLFVCGNGGSAADAQHMVAEFVGKFIKERKALPAIALTTNTSALTAIANDWSYDYVFTRQLEALGKANDVLIGISTSGLSSNVLKALAYARSAGMTTIGLVGGLAMEIEDVCDIVIRVGISSTPVIQERQLAVEHMLCELVEHMLVQKEPMTVCKTYCIDIDGTLCTNTFGEYETAQPYPERIAKINELFYAGNTIILYTARGTVSGINHRALTIRQLNEWGVRYTEIKFGKLDYDIWVDDKALNADCFFRGI
jgi:D-sedoheptulose 7-phosphate isomerase